MIHPTERKRRSYIMHFEEGAEDAVLYQQMNEDKKSSAYYRRGFDFGMTLHLKLRSIK